VSELVGDETQLFASGSGRSTFVQEYLTSQADADRDVAQRCGQARRDACVLDQTSLERPASGVHVDRHSVRKREAEVLHHDRRDGAHGRPGGAERSSVGRGRQ